MWKDILKFGNGAPTVIHEGNLIDEFGWIGEINKRKIGVARLSSGETILVYISAQGTDGKRKGSFYRFRNMTVNHHRKGVSKTGKPNLWMAKYREDMDTPELLELDELYAEGELPMYVRDFPTHREVNNTARLYGVELGHPEHPQFYDRRRDG